METTLAMATATFPGFRKSSAQALSALGAQKENKTELSFILLTYPGKEAVQGLDLSWISLKYLLLSMEKDTFSLRPFDPSQWGLWHIHQLGVLNDCCSLCRCCSCWLQMLWRIIFQRGGKKVLFFVCREQNALQASAHAGLAHAVRLMTEFYFNGLC